MLPPPSTPFPSPPNIFQFQWQIQDFPEEREPTPRGRGGRAPTYEFAQFSQKLHEIERISTPAGGRTSPAPPLDPPLNFMGFFFWNIWQNFRVGSAILGITPNPTGNPGSAAGLCFNLCIVWSRDQVGDIDLGIELLEILPSNRCPRFLSF